MKRKQLQHGFKYIKYIWPILSSFLSLSTPYILTQIKRKTKTAKSNKWRHKDITYFNSALAENGSIFLWQNIKIHVRTPQTINTMIVLIVYCGCDLHQFILLMSSLMRSSRSPESPPSLYRFFNPFNPSAGLFSSKGHINRTTSLKCGPTLSIWCTMSSMHTTPNFPNSYKAKKWNSYKNNSVSGSKEN